MKISKLFHWLYTILMLLPFGALAFNLGGVILSQGSFEMVTFSDVVDMLPIFDYGGVMDNIYTVYEYLLNTIFGFSDTLVNHLCDMLSYWTIISITWLVFDVLMYIPLLIHRFIDKAVGGIE